MLPQQLQFLLRSLESQEWIQVLMKLGDVYVVGGCVRDAFLNKPIKDIDLVVDGTTLDIIKNALRLYGSTKIVGESFAALKFRPTGYEGEDFDIVVPREDRKTGEGHKGFAVKTEGVDINGDLRRRDFTINSIAVNVATGEVKDPFGGLEDLKNHILKATDINAFSEDSLRIMRGLQFASRFGFTLSPTTLKLMKQNAHLISEIPGERIHEEFEKLLKKGGDTAVALNILSETGLDVALLGKKMTAMPDWQEQEFRHLDPLSFYYLLGFKTQQDPAKLYKNRLKGDYELTKQLEVLTAFFKKLGECDSEEELKWLIFVVSSKYPQVLKCQMIPEESTEIYKQMEKGWLPSSPKDIPITGNDVLGMLNSTKQNDPRVGEILRKMYKDALTSEYNWKDRRECLEYLLYEITEKY